MRIASLGIKLALLLLVGVVLAEGCGPVRGETSDLVVTVSTDKNAYYWGETVGINVSVTNTGTSTLDFVFATEHQAGFFVYRLLDDRHRCYPELVWNTMNDLYLQVVTYLTLAPGETKNYRFGWGQTSETDVEIKPGYYLLGGYFLVPISPPCWIFSQPFIFEIRGYGHGH